MSKRMSPIVFDAHTKENTVSQLYSNVRLFRMRRSAYLIGLNICRLRELRGSACGRRTREQTLKQVPGQKRPKLGYEGSMNSYCSCRRSKTSAWDLRALLRVPASQASVHLYAQACRRKEPPAATELFVSAFVFVAFETSFFREDSSKLIVDLFQDEGTVQLVYLGLWGVRPDAVVSKILAKKPTLFPLQGLLRRSKLFQLG